MRHMVMTEIRTESRAAAPAGFAAGLRGFFRSLVSQPALAGGLAMVMVATPLAAFDDDDVLAALEQETSAESMPDIVGIMVRETRERLQRIETASVAVESDAIANDVHVTIPANAFFSWNPFIILYLFQKVIKRLNRSDFSPVVVTITT